MLLSGIGPAEELQPFGIEPIHDLPGVGKNLQDHLGTWLRWEIAEPVSLYGTTSETLESIQREYEEHRTGFLTSNIAEAGAFICTDSTNEIPNIQCFFLPYLLTEAPLTSPHPYGHGITIVFYVNQPASRGQVSLASADPLDQPAIDPNYLDDSADASEYVAGLRRLRELIAAPPLSDLKSEELSPGEGCQSDEELVAYVRDRASSTIFHPVGTYKMGSDSLAVVDPELKVHGIDGLRVVDASIMPLLIGGNTNAPTIMIAEKAADMILNQ